MIITFKLSKHLKKTTLLSLLFITLLMSSAMPQNASDKKVKLLIVIDDTSPLYVKYQTLGKSITKLVVSTVLLGVALPADASYVQNKSFQKTIGEFDRHPVLKAAIINNFKPVSDYFTVDVPNDPALKKGGYKSNLEYAKSHGYHFLLMCDETYPGLATAGKLATLSASTTVRYELFDTDTKKSMDKNAYIASDTTKRTYDAAIADREAFLKEYAGAVTAVMNAIYGRLNRSGFLHEMAATQGLGDYVPSFARYIKQYENSFSLKLKAPSGWHTDRIADTKYAQIAQSRDIKVASKFGIRVDVDLLIKEMNQNVSIEEYANITLERLYALGFTPDDTTKIDLVLKTGDIQLILNGKNGAKYINVIRKFESIYAGIFQIIVLEDFDRYMKEYKNHVEFVLSNAELKAK